MRLVAALGLGQGEQDVAFLAAAALRQVTVDGGLCTFVRQVLTPPLDVRGARRRARPSGTAFPLCTKETTTRPAGYKIGPAHFLE